MEQMKQPSILDLGGAVHSAMNDAMK